MEWDKETDITQEWIKRKSDFTFAEVSAQMSGYSTASKDELQKQQMKIELQQEKMLDQFFASNGREFSFPCS